MMTDEPLAKAIAEMCSCAHAYGMSWAAIHEAVIAAVQMTLQEVGEYTDHSDAAHLLTWVASAQETTLEAEDKQTARDALERVLEEEPE
jgi:hypothetical protein